MFEGHDLEKDAITITAVTFTMPEGDKMYVRTDMLKRVDDGRAVVLPFIKKRKADAEYTKKFAFKKPTWFSSKKEKENYKKGIDRMNNIIANPLHDIDANEGERIVFAIVDGLKEKGLVLKEKSEKSNGETVERKWIFV